MSRMEECLAVAVKTGELSQERAADAAAQYRKMRDGYRRRGLPEPVANARAAADFKELFEAARAERHHKNLHQLNTMREVRDRIYASDNPAEMVMGLVRFAENVKNPGKSAEKLIEAWTEKVNDKMQDMLRAVGLDVIGNSRSPKLLSNLIEELHGKNTGDDVAKKLAKVVSETEEMLVRAFNMRGGNIQILKNRGIPQSHDAGLLKEAGLAKWKEVIRPLLDWSRIIDHDTGQPFAASGETPSAEVVDRFLTDVFTGIITRGWDDADPSMVMGGKALYNRRAEHRVLHFLDGQAQLTYNRAFGTGDPFTVMINSLHGLARDVALMDVLGPNPIAMLEFATQTAMKRAAELVEHNGANPSIVDAAERAGARAKGTLAELSGAASIPHNAAVARFFGGVRAYKVATDLGSAVLSSVTDVATMSAAATTVGMSSRNVLSRHLKLMWDSGARETAAHLGYVAESLADAGAGYSRFMGKMMQNGLASRMSSFVIRATGLAYKTDMAKIAFRFEFSGLLGKNANLPFDKLDGRLRTALERRGFDARDWDMLRHPSGRFTASNGAEFISPLYWAKTQKVLPEDQADDLAMRLSMLMGEHLEYAVPTASAEGMAMVKMGVKSGSIPGELLNSVTMYKGFSVSMMLNQYRRYSAIEGGWNKAYYAAKISAQLTLLGALAVQLKELAKGNDPRPMDTPKFWWAATFQGGGLGIFGDFFAAEQSRTGGGIGEAIAGPVIGLGSDLLKPIASNVTRLTNGEDTTFGRDAANLVRMNTPFLSSAWYLRTAYSRLVADNLQAFLDPEAELIFRRKLKKMAKDYGTQPFIPVRGTGGSFRLPDLSNALGDLK